MNQCFQIQVNGEYREAKAGTTVADLLRQLDIKSERVAVEVNLEILDKGAFAQRSLQEGDRIEIISFIGGGSEEVISNQLSAKDKDSSGVFPKAES
nr:sulfur carrier protein ThiS [Nitrospirota bacterium]